MDGLPRMIELLRMAVLSGATLPLAFASVRDELDGPLGDRVGWLVQRLELGVPLADSLRLWGASEPAAVERICSMLAVAHNSGASVGDALGLAAERLRTEAHHELMTRARRLPVTLLFPVVCCVLPAFGLLTVVPMVMGGVSAVVDPLRSEAR